MMEKISRKGFLKLLDTYKDIISSFSLFVNVILLTRTAIDFCRYEDTSKKRKEL